MESGKKRGSFEVAWNYNAAISCITLNNRPHNYGGLSRPQARRGGVLPTPSSADSTSSCARKCEICFVQIAALLQENHGMQIGVA